VTRRLLIAALAAAAVTTPRPAAADDDDVHVLRFATVAPEGSGWARELVAFGREVERATKGSVQVKFYLGGVAGDETEMAARIRKGQLDGVASGGMICHDVMPSLSVQRVPGVFQTRDEVTHVVNQLRSRLRSEADDAGFTLLATGGLGPSVIFSKKPFSTLEELRSLHMWRWTHDEVAIRANRDMGLDIVSGDLDEVSGWLDDGKLDGIYAIAGAALAFQWYTQVGYFMDLPGDYLTGCVILTNDAFDRLPPHHQETVLAASTKLGLRFEEVGRRQDEVLMGSVFEKQGLQRIEISPSFRAEFFDAMRDARSHLGDELVPSELLDEVQQMLADYRAEHRRTGARRAR